MEKRNMISGKAWRPAILSMLAVLFVALLMAAGTGDSHAASEWNTFRGNSENNAVGAWKTPVSQNETVSLWTKPFGEKVNGMSMWNYSPNTPIIAEGKLVTTSSNEIMKLDLATGNVLQSAKLSGAVNWGYTPITYAKLSNGKRVLFVPLAGKIEAVDFDTLKVLWTYQAPKIRGINSQSISPIVVVNDMVFTGFYVAYDKSNSYVGLNANTGAQVWSYESGGGFYWNGGVAIGSAIIVGTQDGVNNNDVTGVSGGANATSYIMSFDQKTGNVISRIALDKASDICSTIVYDKPSGGNGRVYWTSCGGMLFSAKVDPATGAISDVKKNALAGTQALTVGTPVVYKNRVYLGYKSNEAYGYFAAYDKESLAEVFKVELKGYPKGSPVISTGYESTGYLYAYQPYYQTPGGIQIVKFKVNAASAKDAEVSDLFDANGYEQYSAGSVIVSDNGVLYYKNDSNALFAITKGAAIKLAKATGLKLKFSVKKKKATVTASWKKVGNATDYRVLYRLNEKGAWKNMVTKKTSAKISVANGSFVRVRVRAEFNDAAKSLSGKYSGDALTLAAKSQIKKLKRAKKSFTVQYDKHKGAKGYQVKYSLKKNMKKAKTLKVKGAGKTKVTVRKLKAGKKYYVRVRSFRKLGKKTYYGRWS